MHLEAEALEEIGFARNGQKLPDAAFAGAFPALFHQTDGDPAAAVLAADGKAAHFRQSWGIDLQCAAAYDFAVTRGYEKRRQAGQALLIEFARKGGDEAADCRHVAALRRANRQPAACAGRPALGHAFIMPGILTRGS